MSYSLESELPESVLQTKYRYRLAALYRYTRWPTHATLATQVTTVVKVTAETRGTVAADKSVPVVNYRFSTIQTVRIGARFTGTGLDTVNSRSVGYYDGLTTDPTGSTILMFGI